MNMLMDRAKNVGVLDEVLEATDNRQAPIRFSLMKFCRISLDHKYNNYVAAEVTMSCIMRQNIFCPLPFAICSLPSRS
jgi:hypothetical protein